MAEQNKVRVFIILGLLLVIGLIPLIKAKPPELGGDVISTQFERINGLMSCK